MPNFYDKNKIFVIIAVKIKFFEKRNNFFIVEDNNWLNIIKLWASNDNCIIKLFKFSRQPIVKYFFNSRNIAQLNTICLKHEYDFKTFFYLTLARLGSKLSAYALLT